MLFYLERKKNSVRIFTTGASSTDYCSPNSHNVTAVPVTGGMAIVARKEFAKTVENIIKNNYMAITPIDEDNYDNNKFIDTSDPCFGWIVSSVIIPEDPTDDYRIIHTGETGVSTNILYEGHFHDTNVHLRELMAGALSVCPSFKKAYHAVSLCSVTPPSTLYEFVCKVVDGKNEITSIKVHQFTD